MQQVTSTVAEATDQQRLLDRAARLHEERIGRTAELLVAAPGRVNLIGEHTDYNDGFVFPMAIERYVAVAVSVAPQGRQLTAYSGSMSESIRIPLSGELTRGEPNWANYVRGVVAGFLRRGYDFPGIDLVILSSVPLGAGLSSSAALEVAVATVLEQVSGRVLEPLEKALLCQAAEHEFAAVPCGLMDQLASVFSKRDHALFIDCRTRHVDFVPFHAEEVGVLVCNSNVRHSLGSSAYGTRRSECEYAARSLGIPTLREASLDDLARVSSELESPYRERARHVITENSRVQQFADALSNADFPNAGRLMYESHESLRKDYEVSCRELDVLVDSASEIGESGGVYGSRMTGGGFGGCTVSLVRFSQVSKITARLTRQYRERTGRELDAFVTRASEGVIRRP
ncbi:MAG TPA: galactokinase [Polyangiaceae bacterium]|nr:galactokinase [Polyangiaceae bacterium]